VPPAIDRAWIDANCALRLDMHMRGDPSVYFYSVVDRPSGEPIGLTVTSRVYRRNKLNAELAGKTIRQFHACDETFADLDAAIAALNTQGEIENA